MDMRKQHPRKKCRTAPKTVLRLPDLDQAKSAALKSGRELHRIRFLLGHVSVQTTERYLGRKPRIRNAVNDRIGIQPKCLTGSAG
jgi:hypothetical protein